MSRITNKDLQAVVQQINSLMGKPTDRYTTTNTGGCISSIGNYHISSQYGGVALHQIMNSYGGVRPVFGCGHTTKRELYIQMHAFIRGIEAQTEVSNKV